MVRALQRCRIPMLGRLGVTGPQAMSGENERKLTTRAWRACSNVPTSKKKVWGKAEPIEGEFRLWLTVRMHSKTVKANPRYFFTITRAVFEERVHVGCITMFEETEATMATGHKGFRVCVESRSLQLRGLAAVAQQGQHGEGERHRTLSRFRKKAARALEEIDNNVSFIDMEGEESNDYELSHVVMRDEDEPYRAEDPEAPPAEVNRMLPPPVPQQTQPNDTR
eukprot:g1883.t1